MREPRALHLYTGEHLLAKIEAGFDDLSRFNRIVAHAVGQRLC